MNSIHKIISIVAVLYLLKHVHREDQDTINVEVQEHVVAKKLQKNTPKICYKKSQQWQTYWKCVNSLEHLSEY